MRLNYILKDLFFVWKTQKKDTVLVILLVHVLLRQYVGLGASTCTLTLMTCYSQSVGFRGVGPPFAALTSSTPLGRFSTRFEDLRSGTNVGWGELCVDSSQRCFILKLSLGLSAGLISSTPNSLIRVFKDLALCTAAQSNRKIQTVPRTSGAWNCSEHLLPKHSSFHRN